MEFVHLHHVMIHLRPVARAIGCHHADATAVTLATASARQVLHIAMPDFMTGVGGWGPGRWRWFTSYKLMFRSIGIEPRNDGCSVVTSGIWSLQCGWPRSKIHIQMLKQNLRWTSLGWFLRLSKLFRSKATYIEWNCTRGYVYSFSML